MDTERSRWPVTVGLGFACIACITTAQATEPCGDFDECRVLVEINATDGDIGFHWLADAGDLVATAIVDPRGRRIFANGAFGPLREQTLTETFGESAEPVCRPWLVEDPDDVVVTLSQFVRRWPAGAYRFHGTTDDGETIHGQTALTHWLPAAPRNLVYSRGVITWEAGQALGACATRDQLWRLVAAGVLPIHPMNVPVAAWEVVLELEDGSNRSFSVRLPARGPNAQTSVTVPAEFLYSVAPDTPAKVEIGAIGGRLEIGDDDNATFSEVGGLCLNRARGCAEPE
ncbi:MAG TPA: hypothetical protein VF055_05850 [Steroidobacteraceae bacterium]